VRDLCENRPVRIAACGAWTAAALLAAAAPATSGDDPALEVRIVESHNRVLLGWLAAARAGRIPREGVTLIHVDAHADLAAPRGPLAPGFPQDDLALFERTDIASFVLAAVRAGLVDEVVWVHPPWSHQLPDGARAVRLGSLPSGALAVDDPSDFYVLGAGWAPAASLSDVQTLRLRAIELPDALREPLLADGPTILDVDLDVFATHNPAADRLRSAGLGDADLDRLRAIFAPEGLGLAADPGARRVEVQALQDAVGALASGSLRALPGAALVFWRRGVGPGDLWALWDMLGRAREPAQEVLLEEGRLLIGLPERRADPAEIADTARCISELVGRGIVRPSLLTIARSVDDGYTPREAWPLIEWSLLGALAPVLPGATVQFDAGLRPAPRPPAGGPSAAMPGAPPRAP
jgi:hypothetical protein